MTEADKMKNGVLYVASDTQLYQKRQRAKELLFDYHALRPGQQREQKEILIKLFGKIGEQFSIERPFYCDYGANIFIGDHFYANYNCVVLDGAKVKIGNHVLFGPNVSLFTAGHPIHYQLREQELEFALPITIADHVWIGGGSIVNPGVNIGKYSVIGSGSVVTKSLPEGVVAAGNPCRIIREITREDLDRNQWNR